MAHYRTTGALACYVLCAALACGCTGLLGSAESDSGDEPGDVPFGYGTTPFDVSSARYAYSIPQFGSRYYSLALSRDEELIAAAGRNGTVVVWRVGTGERLRLIETDDPCVRALDISPDGRYIVTGGLYEPAKLWRLSTGEFVRAFGDAGESVSAAVFTPAGRHLVTGGSGDDPPVRIWDVETGTPTGSLPGHGYTVKSIAFSADGTYLVTGSVDHTARVWRFPATLLGQVSDTWNGVSAVAITRDGSLVAASYGGNTKVFTRTGDVRHELPAGGALGFSPDGRHLITVRDTYYLQVWDVESGSLVREWPRPYGGYTVHALRVSSDGRRAFTASSDHAVKVWDIVTGEEIGQYGYGILTAYAVTPDGETLVTGHGTGTINAWDISTGELLRRVAQKAVDVRCVAISADGRMVAAGGGYGDPTVRVWRLEDGTLLHTFAGHTDIVRDVAFFPDGRVASYGYETAVRVWDTKTGSEVAVLSEPTEDAGRVVVSPDGERIAAGGYGGTDIWRATADSVAWERRVQGGSPLGFTPTGQFLVTEGCGFQVWQIDTGEPVATVEAPAYTQGSAILSPDGRHIIIPGDTFPRAVLFRPGSESARSDASGVSTEPAEGSDSYGFVEFRSLSDGGVVRTIKFEEAVRTVAVSANGRALIAAYYPRYRRETLHVFLAQ